MARSAPRVAAVVGIITIVLALVAGCRLPGADGVTASELPPEPAVSAAAGAALAALRVVPEDTGHHYDRDDWPHWSSVGGGCDVRDRVMHQTGRHVTTKTTDDGCVVFGEWVSWYDGTLLRASDEGRSTRWEQSSDGGATWMTSRPGQLDHVVPLAEANRSGVRDWDEADRERYANDTRFLLFGSAASNQEKGGNDPASWWPVERYRCAYASLWVQAKTAYRLTVDQAEHDAIASVLQRCEIGTNGR